MTKSTAVVPDLSSRLQGCRRAVADAKSGYDAELEIRRQLVNEAIDEGMSYREIAKALGGGTGLVSKILSKAEPKEQP